jgi:uncharacterized OsmC-like protein
MSATTQLPTNREKAPLNGVDTPSLLATINAVRENRPLANFQVRAVNRWERGTHSRSRIESFNGAGGDHKHVRAFTFDADHPPVLTGSDAGPTPVEFLLVALGACLTAGVATIAQYRGISLRSVTAILEGDMDLRGIMGVDRDVRNGYQGIRVSFDIDADATREELAALVAQSQKRSAVFDVITNPTAVTVGLA